MAVAAENKGTMDMFLTRALERVQQDAYRKAPLRDACTDTLGTVSAAASPSSSTTCCTAAVCHCLTCACSLQSRRSQSSSSEWASRPPLLEMLRRRTCEERSLDLVGGNTVLMLRVCIQ